MPKPLMGGPKAAAAVVEVVGCAGLRAVVDVARDEFGSLAQAVRRAPASSNAAIGTHHERPTLFRTSRGAMGGIVRPAPCGCTDPASQTRTPRDGRRKRNGTNNDGASSPTYGPQRVRRDLGDIVADPVYSANPADWQLPLLAMRSVPWFNREYLEASPAR
jgi:hypothetical protein